MELFAKFTFIEKLPEAIAKGGKIRSFKIGNDYYRLVPCNFNVIAANLVEGKYSVNHTNGRALNVVINARRLSDINQYSNYSFPRIIRKDEDQSNLTRVNPNLNVDHMAVYVGKVLEKMEDDLDMNEQTIKKAKDLMHAAFGEFIYNNLSEFTDIAPFKGDSFNKTTFAKIINMGSRYTGYDGLYMFESKVAFMLNILVDSMNLFFSKQELKTVECVNKMLSYIRIKRENCWMLADILKYEFLNDETEIISTISIISGSSEVEYKDITEIPQKLWSHNLTNIDIDSMTKNARACDQHGRVIYVKYKTYEEMETELKTDDGHVLIDVMPINDESAIFKLARVDNTSPMIIRDIETHGNIKTYIIKSTQYTELAIMARNRLRDALLFVTRLALFDYPIFLKKEKHAFSPTSMQRYFKVLFHKEFISSNITKMYDELYDIMLSYLLKDPDSDLTGCAEYEDKLNSLENNLTKINNFIVGKLAVINASIDNPDIDRLLHQIIDIYKYDILLML